MSTTPFEPNRRPGQPSDDLSGDRMAAADPGHGAPEPESGFGVTGEQPDQPPETRDPRERSTGGKIRRWIRALTRR